MTTGVVDIKIFGPPVASADLPAGGFQVGPDNNPIGVNPIPGSPVGGTPVGGSPVGGSPVGGSPVGGSPVGGKPWPMVQLDGIYRPAGPNGLPLMVPPGCEADGYRELLVHEQDTNWISQYTQFHMFMGIVNQGLQFNDGSQNYASLNAISGFPGIGYTMFVFPTVVTNPSGAVSNLIFPSGASLFTSNRQTTSSNYVVSTYDQTYSQTSTSVTTTLTQSGSTTFDVAQLGFMPAYYDAQYAQFMALWDGTSPNQFTNFNALVGSELATNAFAVYSSYQLSQTYTVPIAGAITIEYGISATL